MNSKSRLAKGEALHLAHVSEFYKLMLGEAQKGDIGDISNQRSSGKLDEFSVISASSSLTQADLASMLARGKSAGLISHLNPYILDALRRKSSLSQIVQVIGASPNKDLQGITSRDLFVAAALSVSDTTLRVRAELM